MADIRSNQNIKIKFEGTGECEAMRKMFVGGINRDTTDEVFL